ncbi:MAG: hypothetical protein AAF385_10510 [Pseudomonadota bacterium]
MKGILWHLIQIMLFRSSPAVLPRSTVVLVSVAVLSFLAALLSYETPLEEGVERAPLALLMLISLGVYAIYYGLLRFYNRGDRTVQTLTAVIGTETIINILITLWALVSLTLSLPDVLSANVFLALFVWSIVISARIMADALDWPLFGGAILVVTLHILVLSVLFNSSGPASPDVAWLLPLGGDSLI